MILVGGLVLLLERPGTKDFVRRLLTAEAGPGCPRPLFEGAEHGGIEHIVA